MFSKVEKNDMLLYKSKAKGWELGERELEERREYFNSKRFSHLSLLFLFNSNFFPFVLHWVWSSNFSKVFISFCSSSWSLLYIWDYRGSILWFSEWMNGWMFKKFELRFQNFLESLRNGLEWRERDSFVYRDDASMEIEASCQFKNKGKNWKDTTQNWVSDMKTTASYGCSEVFIPSVLFLEKWWLIWRGHWQVGGER